jgi:hypothetical protein
MKRTLSIISCIVALFTLTSCDWFVLDNLDAWDAQVEGKIIDKGTNQPLQMEQGSNINVYEKVGYQYKEDGQPRKWDGDAAIGWKVKNNGTYVNKLTFAGTYRFDTKNNNFQADTVRFELKPGANTQDFYVTPYVRILNPSVSWDGSKINANFNVEVAVPGTRISRVEVCVYPDRWVRHSQNNCANDPGAYKVNPTETSFSLSVDSKAAANANEFQYDRIHYIRIAALGQNSLNTGNSYNYSPVYKLEKGQITEVTDW